MDGRNYSQAYAIILGVLGGLILGAILMVAGEWNTQRILAADKAARDHHTVRCDSLTADQQRAELRCWQIATPIVQRKE